MLGKNGLLSDLSVDPNQTVITECYRIIDAAQLWYVRPELFNGNGNQSFAHMDANILGISKEENSVEWKTEFAMFRFENLRFRAFDLIAVCNDGTKLEFRNIYSDTRPKLHR